VLIAIVLAVVVFAFLGLRARSVSVGNDAPLESKPTPTPVPLKTYTSSFEGATIQYPSTWTLDVQSYPEDGVGAASATFTSPHGIILNFDAPRPQGGGSCTENCHYTADHVETMAAPDLDMVLETETIASKTSTVLGAMNREDAGKLEIEASVPYADVNEFPYTSHAHPSFSNLLMSGQITPDQSKTLDFKQAKDIIQSLHYQ
jgi:hypothetical protein